MRRRCTHATLLSVAQELEESVAVRDEQIESLSQQASESNAQAARNADTLQELTARTKALGAEKEELEARLQEATTSHTQQLQAFEGRYVSAARPFFGFFGLSDEETARRATDLHDVRAHF